MNTAVIIISKILEVTHWVGCAFMIALTFVFASGNTSFAHFLSDVTESSSDVELYGYSLLTANGGAIPTGALVLFFVTGIIVMAIMAMVFRYIYLIFKTAEGKTKISEGATPFQQPIVDMTRKVGIFCIAVPVIEFITLIVTQIMIVTGGGAYNHLETNVQFGMVLFGLVILCLSRFFAYGLELQKDTEGLV